MARITQKQIIESLNQLKEIKPRNEWAVLLKSQILAEKEATLIPIKIKKEILVPVKPADPKETPAVKSPGIMDVLSSVFFQRKLAYAFAVVLFLIVGVFGFTRNTMPGDLLFPVKKIAEQSQATLTGQTGLKQDIATLSSRINDLSQVAKEGKTNNIPSAISEVSANVKDLAQNLKNNPTQDPQTIKEIANSLKTLADVPGTDLSQNPDVQNLYQTIVESQIADLKKTTLTDGQNNILTRAEDLAGQGKYTDALEKIWTITNNTNNNPVNSASSESPANLIDTTTPANQ